MSIKQARQVRDSFLRRAAELERLNHEAMKAASPNREKMWLRKQRALDLRLAARALKDCHELASALARAHELIDDEMLGRRLAADVDLLERVRNEEVSS